MTLENEVFWQEWVNPFMLADLHDKSCLDLKFLLKSNNLVINPYAAGG